MIQVFRETLYCQAYRDDGALNTDLTNGPPPDGRIGQGAAPTPAVTPRFS
ncbi:hypothetical protein [Roseovarius sp. MMSF_3281]|nr:hypothetical protein [Roseovarius sp. MMSF_3281]